MVKNNPKKIKTNFFNQETLSVAQSLLGKVLCVKNGRKTIKGIITETEAYKGEDDLASHASKGRTKRTETMYQKYGTVYVYMIYGVYFCLNIVTEKIDYPSAVLIRGIKEINGPGRLCRYFGINKSFNNLDVFGDKIWLEDWGIKVAQKDIIASKRVGVDYAKHCKDYLWRFSLVGSFFFP